MPQAIPLPATPGDLLIQRGGAFVAAGFVLTGAYLFTAVQTINLSGYDAPVAPVGLTVVGAAASNCPIQGESYGGATLFIGYRSNGQPGGSLSGVGAGENLSLIGGAGRTSSGPYTGSTGLISIVATETFIAGTNLGTAVVIAATPTGSGGRAEVLRVQEGAVGLGAYTPVAGDGLLQFLSGTTKANGSKYGDVYFYRLSSGFMSLNPTGTGATDRRGITFARGGYSTPGGLAADADGDKLVLYNGDSQHSVIGQGPSQDFWFKSINGSGGARFDWYVGSSSPLRIFSLDFAGNVLGDATNGGDWKIQRLGKTLCIKEGTNAKMGVATLVAGTVTVSTTAVTANSRIFLCHQNSAGTRGSVAVTTITAGTSFVITSTNAADTSTIAWFILEPA
jgi:hypothetical protein